MRKPLVSIVVAIYKSERFLDKLIPSIIGQTYQNLEIILVDDGSPDNSGLICDSYAQQDSRIQVIHKENGGACEARNIGISHASGEYLTVIDGDDWLAPDYVDYLIELIQLPGVNMSMTDSIFTSRDSKQNKEDKVTVLSSEEALTQLIYPKVPIGPWNKMYRKKILEENNISFSTKWSGEGLFFSVMAAQASEKVALGHRRVYYYRLDNENSGLTHYDVNMGLNALENIKNIKQCLNIRSKRVLNACDWHIWKNYGYLLFLIIATNQTDCCEAQYRNCISEIRKMLPRVLLKSELEAREKIKMLIQGCFPVWWAKRRVVIEQQNRLRDGIDRG